MSTQTKTKRNVTTIETEVLGTLSWTKFNKLLKSHGGNQSALARSLSAEYNVNVAPGTVRKWKAQLQRKRAAV